MPYTNMTLDELARHIGMDAREVRRLAEKGDLPGQMVGGQWRFNRAALLDWLQQEMHALDEIDRRNLERAMATQRDAALLGALLPPAAIEMNLPARSRNSVLRELVKVVDRAGLLWNGPELLEGLEAREAIASTALAGGLGLPHPARPMPDATAEPLIGVARVPAGIPFGAPDGQLTYLFVLLCSHDDRQHLHALARISLTFTPELIAILRHCEDRDTALAAILAAEQQQLQARR